MCPGDPRPSDWLAGGGTGLVRQPSVSMTSRGWEGLSAKRRVQMPNGPADWLRGAGALPPGRLEGGAWDRVPALATGLAKMIMAARTSQRALTRVASGCRPKSSSVTEAPARGSARNVR